MADPQPFSPEKVKSLFDLTGKTAIITGAAGFLGRALAKGLTLYGADVVLSGRTQSTLDDTAKEINALGGGKAITVVADVVDEASVDNLIAQTVKEFGKVDIMVPVGGIADRYPAEEFPLDAWRKVMDTNVMGTWLSCQKAGKWMIDNKKPGKIITIGSVRGYAGHPGGYGAYGTSKGAVHLMTLQLATEWAKYKINVNCVAPCIFWTPLTKQVLEDEKLKQVFLARIPWGRAAIPDDVIGAAIYYASPASDFVTGTILPVDGGTVGG
jgi:NAD(P)-dependent dehydrogenase (short-subunit alcohol dehydrogenase family)